MWQLSMGPRDEPSLLTFLQSGDLPRMLSYPKGRANMKVEPAVGDHVVITCKARNELLGSFNTASIRLNEVSSLTLLLPTLSTS
jgi:hypothetical protein